MKKLWPYLIIATLVIALFFSMKGCVQREVREHYVLQHAPAVFDSGKIWKDDAGREHRRSEALAADLQTMQLLNDELLDSVARMNDVRTKDLQQITWLSTELSGHHQAPVVNAAAGGHTAVSFQYSNPFLDIYGTGSVMNDSLSDLWLDYHVRDSLVITTLRKRIALFRKGTFVDVTSANPEMHIAGVKSLIIRDRPKRWGIGLQLGATYSFTAGWQPYLGAGISYNLIRF